MSLLSIRQLQLFIDATCRYSIVALAFTAVANHVALGVEMTADAMPPNYSKEIPNLGTATKYVKGAPSPDAGASRITTLGITVIDWTGHLKDGRSVRGVRVCSVTPGAAGAVAGLQSEDVAVATALMAGFLIAGMFFPLAVLGAMAVQGLEIGKSYDLIIAVDGQRTHDVSEFREALTGATAGELLYLVVVRGGRRNSVEVAVQ
jgi:S1-C subfamily serine protease